MDFFSSATEIVRGIFYVIVFFGGSIFVHELGHFLVAKFFGLRIDVFSIGFGPKIFGKKIGETEYRVSWIPLGGYVSLPQLEKDSGGGIAVGSDENSNETKKLSYGAKVTVFAAGAFFNVLFAILCAVILWIAKTPTTAGFSDNLVGNVAEQIETTQGTFVKSPAAKAGILPGDRILEIDGARVKTFSDIIAKIALGSARTENGEPMASMKILRGNAEISLEVFPVLSSQNPRSGDFIRRIGIEPSMPLIISDRNGTNKLPEGLKNGDKIVALDLLDGAGPHALFSLSQYSDFLGKASENAPVALTIERGENAEKFVVKITPKPIPQLRERAKISFSENGKPYELQLVPVPDDLKDFSENAPRKNLVVLYALPEELSAAKFCPIGTKIEAVGVSDSSGTAGKIYRINSLEDFSKIISNDAGTLTLFLVEPNGDATTAELHDACASLVPAKEILRLGIPLERQVILVRESPWKQIYDAAELTVSSIAGLLNPNSDIGVKQLNGVFSIAELYYDISFDLRRVLMLTLLININLAFLNLLPIPVLDGGHILFATIEKISGKPFPKKVAVQWTFILLLLVFMGFVLFFDFFRTLGNSNLREQQLIYLHQFDNPSESQK